MRTALAPPALLALLLAAAPACGTTPPSRFYRLEATATAPAPGAARSLAIDVGPVVLDGALDRSQMLTRLGQNEVAVHEFSRWAEPLDGNIASVLAEDLSMLTGSPNVGVVPDASTHLDAWQISMHVLHCEAGTDGKARLVVRWRLFPPGQSEPSLTRRSELQADLPSGDATGDAAGAAAGALSGCLAELAGQMAAALPAK